MTVSAELTDRPRTPDEQSVTTVSTGRVAAAAARDSPLPIVD